MIWRGTAYVLGKSICSDCQNVAAALALCGWRVRSHDLDRAVEFWERHFGELSWRRQRIAADVRARLAEQNDIYPVTILVADSSAEALAKAEVLGLKGIMERIESEPAGAGGALPSGEEQAPRPPGMNGSSSSVRRARTSPRPDAPKPSEEHT